MIAVADVVATWHALDAGYKLLIGTYLALVTTYRALQPVYPKTKQKAWILTAIGSAAVTVCSLPFVVSLILQKGDLVRLVEIPWWSRSACRIFQAYLIS